MATEIERTFLVNPANVPELGTPLDIEQAYLSEEPCVRIRTLSREGVTIARVTIKGPGTVERAEFEWEIPVKDAQEILGDGLWKTALSKCRYLVSRWEIDEFTSGELEGLWIAEIELESRDEEFTKPDWLGPEVSEDPRFSNMALARDGVPDCYWEWLKTGEWDGAGLGTEADDPT